MIDEQLGFYSSLTVYDTDHCKMPLNFVSTYNVLTRTTVLVASPNSLCIICDGEPTIDLFPALCHAIQRDRSRVVLDDIEEGTRRGRSVYGPMSVSEATSWRDHSDNTCFFAHLIVLPVDGHPNKKEHWIIRVDS